MLRLGVLFLSVTKTLGDDDTVEVPTSCVGQLDGEYILKPLADDEYPLVRTRCSDEYMLIDISVEPAWKEYFTSFDQWHYDMGGPAKNDQGNYNEWFIPAPADPDVDPEDPNADYAVTKTDYRPTKEDIAGFDKPTSYLISPQCDVCDAEDTYHQQYGDKTTYNMNAAAYGLFFGQRRPACDFDWDSMMCKTCSHNSDGNMVSYMRPYSFSFEDKQQDQKTIIGVCLTEVRNAYSFAIRTWYDFTQYGSYSYKPSIGIGGRFCQCIKVKQDEATYVSVDKDVYEAKRAEMFVVEEPEQEEEAQPDVTYLYNADFEMGTYRITEPGTYMLQEDIVLNFNAPDEDVLDMESPNDPAFDWWWPPSQDDEIKAKYPGAGYKAREQYMLGYFAGITIETHDVVLDLNGHKIEMSREFFYAQPFFAIIELMSQPFLPNQGPGFFGADPQFAENVVIRNGILGRSSHHGIHGSKNKNIRIENVKIQYFQTHGIQMNGYDGVEIVDVDVGPTTDEAFMSHNYAHIRVLLPYLYKMANWDDAHREATISFDPLLRSDNGREYTLNELLEIVVPKLDKVLKYVLSDDFDKDELKKLWHKDEDFKLFTNYDGLPYGSVLYGVYLNYPGSGIFGWDVSDLRSKNVYIKNLAVHDLKHAGKEVLGLTKNQNRFIVNTLLAPLNLEHLFGDMDTIKEWVYNSYTSTKSLTQPKYKGNIATDIYFAMFKFGSDRWDEWWMGVPYMGLGDARLLNWAQGEDDEALDSGKYGGSWWEPLCACDGMIHPGKGLLGMKLTNVDDVVFDGYIKVYNLEDLSPLGEDGVCVIPTNGEAADMGKEVNSQQTPYQVAYSMNQVFGISVELSGVTLKPDTSIQVSNLQSHTGRVLGFSSWFSTSYDVEDKAAIQVNDLIAGVDVAKTRFSYTSMPNHASEACSIVVYDGHQVSVRVDDFLDESKTTVNQYCIHGNTGCGGIDGRYTNMANVANADCDFSGNSEIIAARVAASSATHTTTAISRFTQMSQYTVAIIMLSLVIVAVVTVKAISMCGGRTDYMPIKN